MSLSLKDLQKKKPIPEKYLSTKARKELEAGKKKIPVKKEKPKLKKKKMHVAQHRLFSKLQDMGYSSEQLLSIVGSDNKSYMRKGTVLKFPKQLLTMSQIEQLWHLAKADLTINEFLFDYLKFGEANMSTEAEFSVRMAKLLYEPTMRVSKDMPKRVIPRALQRKVRESYEEFKALPKEEKSKALWI